MKLICHVENVLIIFAASGFSLKLTANTVSLSFPISFCAFSKMGNSRLQGPHQEAQKVRITSFPCWLLSGAATPVTALRALKSGANDPTAGPVDFGDVPAADESQEREATREKNSSLMRVPCVARGAYAAYTVVPPTTVRLMRISLILTGSTVCGSSSRTTQSGSLPAVMEPFSDSSRVAYAPFSVLTRSASPTPIR